MLSLMAILSLIAAGAEPAAMDREAALEAFAHRLEREGEVVEAIFSMFGRDQHARFVIIDLMQRDDIPAPDHAWLMERAGAMISELDARHADRLAVILEQHSWADLAAMRARTVNNAFILLQHASPDMQARWLPDIREQVQAGVLPGSSYALLSDRAALAMNEPQRYGTQIICQDGEHSLDNLAEPETVDERRAALGLPPLAEYIAESAELYGPCSN